MTKTIRPIQVHQLFSTPLYHGVMASDQEMASWIQSLREACLDIESQDHAGAQWSRQKNYHGYTSYASLNDLEHRHPTFFDLKQRLDKHAKAATKAFWLDIAPRSLKLSGLWINILQPLGHHSNHIHPHSVISGTIYVDIPDGAARLKLEDPRLDRFMNAPLRSPEAPLTAQSYFTPDVLAGDILIWESWLRHEVPMNQGQNDRISISFNYNCR